MRALIVPRHVVMGVVQTDKPVDAEAVSHMLPRRENILNITSQVDQLGCGPAWIEHSLYCELRVALREDLGRTRSVRERLVQLSEGALKQLFKLSRGAFPELHSSQGSERGRVVPLSHPLCRDSRQV